MRCAGVAFGDPGLHLVVVVGEIVFRDLVGRRGPDTIMPENISQRLVEMLGRIRPADIVRVQPITSRGTDRLHDSPLEEAVCCEPVSEVRSGVLGKFKL